jgi:heme-degrading monooxygenase HmoA
LSKSQEAYFAVIFSSQRTPHEESQYEETASRMAELAKEQTGFLGMDSARDSEGFGITISYWKDEEIIKNWKSNGEHIFAQKRSRSEWYSSFKIRICKVEREYGSEASK